MVITDSITDQLDVLSIAFGILYIFLLLFIFLDFILGLALWSM